MFSTVERLWSPGAGPGSWDVFFAYVSVLLAKLCRCVRVCCEAALTRSPKNTSLAVKRVRSHRPFPLVRTDLAAAVPAVKSAQLGEYQTVASIT